MAGVRPEPAGRVLGVGDDQVDRFACATRPGNARDDDLAPRLADDVADQQQPHDGTLLAIVALRVRRSRLGRETARLAISGDFRDPRFAQHRHLDFAGIRQLLFERLGDVAADLGGRGVGRVLGADDHAQLAAGLDGKGLLDAVEAGGDRFQLFHPLDVALERFAAGAGREALQASAAATSTV